MENTLSKGLFELNRGTSAQSLRIAEKIRRIQELMPYALFMAWYVSTSLDDEELESQLDEKLEELEGDHA